MTAVRRDAAKAAIRSRIASGALKPGDRIGGNLVGIARENGVGKTTMRDALGDLVAEGVVRGDHGIGYFVTDDPAAALAGQSPDGELPAIVRKLQDDVLNLKADVAELQSQRGIKRQAQKRERADERSG